MIEASDSTARNNTSSQQTGNFLVIYPSEKGMKELINKPKKGTNTSHQ